MKRKPINRRQPLSEAIKQQSKLYDKHKEYSEKSLEELKEILPILGGGYKKVCEYVIRLKESEKNLEGNVE